MKDNVGPVLEAYQKLYGIRRAEQVIQREYSSDLIKTPVHLSIGAEAITVGVLQGLPVDSKVFGTYRSHAAFLALTEDYLGFFGELYGRQIGSSKGKAGSMHLMSPENGLIATSAVVGTTIPVAVGYALAEKIKGRPTITVVFFGDGAIEEGVFFESLNFASLHRLKILFVCEDNDLAIHADPTTRRGFLSVKELVSVFKLKYINVNGADFFDVFAGTQTLFETMKADSRPAFLHAKYHRALEHVGISEDYQFGYRCKPEDSHQFDPILNFEKSKKLENLDLESIRKKVNDQIDTALSQALRSPFPHPEELYKDVLAEKGNH